MVESNWIPMQTQLYLAQIVWSCTTREKVCEVSPYTDEYDAITDVHVVRGATLWTDQHTNKEYILVFNEALWMGDTITHSLINPNQ